MSLFPNRHDLDTQQVQVLSNALHPEYECLPLVGIPVEDENQVHDGVHPCTDASCPCQQYGYEVQA